MSVLLFYGLLAFAQVANEDTNALDTSSILYNIAYIEPRFAPTPVKPVRGIYVPVGNGYCVDFVKAHGFEGYSGNANTWIRYAVEGAIGWPGDALLLDEGPTINGVRYQHLVLIIGTDGGYNVVEQNGAGGRYVIDYRTIPFDYDKIVAVIPKPALKIDL